jgi:DNA repair protein RadC
MLSKGGVSGTIADVKLIFKNALEHTASSIIVCHNHPSGNLDPSDQDRAITEKIRAAGKILDIGLLDHLIISDNNYYSFADNGLI